MSGATDQRNAPSGREGRRGFLGLGRGDGIVLAAVAVCGAAAAAIALWPRGTGEPPVVSVDGTVIGQADARVRIRDIARSRLSQTVRLRSPGHTFSLTWAQLGAQVDVDLLVRLVEGAARPHGPVRRHAASVGVRTIRIDLPVTLDSSEVIEALLAVKEKVDRAPQNARFDFSANAVLPEKPGYAMDVFATAERLEDALKRGADTVDIAGRTLPAAITREELAGIDVRAVAGFYETPYSRMKKDADRTHNVRLGASILDGTIIPPGGRFSFNEVVGERSQARGFRYAPVIAGGKIVEGMGGGTCQVASTLYAAAFFAGLTIEDRVPHSRPSSYIKLGLDATVSYPSKDLVLRNPLPYPVVIHFTVSGGVARAEIRAKERPFTVTLLRRVVDTIDYPVRVVDDPSLPRGKEVVTQRGVLGYVVRRYRIIERGKVAYRFQSYDRYPPTVEFVHRGIGVPGHIPPDAKPPKPDTHKPYRASASLRMVQGVNLWYEQNHQ